MLRALVLGLGFVLCNSAMADQSTPWEDGMFVTRVSRNGDQAVVKVNQADPAALATGCADSSGLHYRFKLYDVVNDEATFTQFATDFQLAQMAHMYATTGLEHQIKLFWDGCIDGQLNLTRIVVQSVLSAP